jgi:hypothetical protein
MACLGLVQKHSKTSSVAQPFSLMSAELDEE